MPLSWYLMLAAALFCVGLYGMLAERHLITMLMSLELMLNAVILNMVAFARYLEPQALHGKTFALFIYALAAADAVLGLALTVLVWRNRDTVAIDKINTLKG
ncbi:MAG: NADH-quinone oxidoreductase subunit NuoK [Anaerolineae bacterium]|nr:NADH-quinone oxidoreductase subunit NuoK [Anaerolineae bacterium]